MNNVSIFAKGIYPTTDIYPMLKNCLINEEYFICSNDYINLCYKISNQEIKGCFDTKIILNIIANLRPDVPYMVENNASNTCISQGNFKLNIAKIPEENYPISVPTELKEEIFYSKLIEIFKNISSFMGVDASRTWCLGIHIKENMIYTTNNTVCCGVMNNFIMNDRFIPSQLVEKIIQLSEKGYIPEYWIDNDNITGVKYKEGHLLFCRKSADPMDLSKPLIMSEEIPWIEITDELRDNIKKVVSFTSELYVDFDNDIIQTHKDKDFGAKIKYKESFGIGGAYIHKYFIPLIDFNTHFRFYKDRVMFYKKQEDIQYYFVEVRYVI